jgi:hypothetical protein
LLSFECIFEKDREKEKREKKRKQRTFGVFSDDDDIEPLEARGHARGVKAVTEVDVEVERCFY